MERTMLQNRSRLGTGRILFLTCLLTVFGLCLNFPSAVTLAETENRVLVQDDAVLLTQEEAAELESRYRQFAETSGWDAMALTVSDAEGYDTGDYGDLFFLDHCSQDNGVINIIDMDNRQIYLYTSGEAIDYLTDARIETVLDDAYDYVSSGNYYDALRVMMEDVSAFYDAGVPSGAYRYDEETGDITYYEEKRSLTSGELLICLLAGLAAAAVLFGNTAARYQMKLGGYRYDFRKGSKLSLSRKEDRFVNRTVTRRHIPKNPPSGGGGGGGRSTVHTGPSGHSHGGGGRGF